MQVNGHVVVQQTARASMRGELVTEELAYDGGRAVTVYVPPRAPEAILYAADGQRLAQWGVRLETADAPATMIVGVHGRTEEKERLEEYSPERFAAHEQFFVAEVRRWMAARWGTTFGRKRTAVLGVSAGGELALALGLKHPRIYGAVLCASPGGGYRPTGRLAKPVPRTYLVAGTEEPFFLQNARRWQAALEEAGGEVRMTERSGGHGGDFWQAEFPLMVKWAFRR